MAARIIDGSAMANALRQRVKERVAEMADKARRPVYLTAIMVGSSPAGELYAQREREASKTVGIAYELITLPEDASFELVSERIARLNHDPTVTVIMLHLPIPAHLDATTVQYLIDPHKDVEG